MDLKKYESAINLLVAARGGQAEAINTLIAASLAMLASAPDTLVDAIDAAGDVFEPIVKGLPQAHAGVYVAPSEDEQFMMELLKAFRSERPRTCNGMVPAIKFWRMKTGSGLKEAKDAVEVITQRPTSQVSDCVKHLNYFERDRLFLLRDIMTNISVNDPIIWDVNGF